MRMGTMKNTIMRIPQSNTASPPFPVRLEDGQGGAACEILPSREEPSGIFTLKKMAQLAEMIFASFQV